ncbi:MAG: hypothetical protein ACE5JG_04515 [Planctomycetota bacterium]
MRFFRPFVWVALSLSVCVPAALVHAGKRPPRRAPPAARMLRTLDAQQCTELAELARRAAGLRAEHEAALARLQPEFRTALLRLREGVSADRELRPETMKAAGGLNHGVTMERARFLKQVGPIEREALGVLGPRQRRWFAARPGPRAGADAQLARIRREMARIHAEQYGSLGRLGRWLLTPGLCDALQARAEGRKVGLHRATRDTLHPGSTEIRALRAEINLWNLMNGMHFTPEQLAAIASAAGSAPPRARAAVDRVLAVLSEEQRAVLLDYKPCLVPPKNLRDPVRAGQAHDSTAHLKLLTRLRRIPARHFTVAGERILDYALARIEERHGSYDPVERLACHLLLARTAGRARAMDDVEFQVAGEELAQDLAPLFRREGLRQELKEAVGADRVVRDKAARFLLDPQMAALCRARIELLVSGPPIRPEGPIVKAERCEECGTP